MSLLGVHIEQNSLNIFLPCWGFEPPSTSWGCCPADHWVIIIHMIRYEQIALGDDFSGFCFPLDSIRTENVRCNLCWKDEHTLFIGWGKTIKVRSELSGSGHSYFSHYYRK